MMSQLSIRLLKRLVSVQKLRMDERGKLDLSAELHCAPIELLEAERELIALDYCQNCPVVDGVFEIAITAQGIEAAQLV